MLLVRGGRVRNIVRGGAPGYELQGESVGFLKLRRRPPALLRELLARRVAAGAHGHRARGGLSRSAGARGRSASSASTALPWTEIDFPEDVERAERVILPGHRSGARPRRSATRSSLASPGDAGGARSPACRCSLRTILRCSARASSGCTLAGAAAVRPTRASASRSASTPSSPSDGALRVVVGAGTVIDAGLVRRLVADERCRGEVLELRARRASRVRPGDAPRGTAAAAARSGRPPPRAGALEQSLLLGLENPRDGYLDRLLHRRLSRPLTRRLLPRRSRRTPSRSSGIALGIAGGLLLGVAEPGVDACVAVVAPAALERARLQRRRAGPPPLRRVQARALARRHRRYGRAPALCSAASALRLSRAGRAAGRARSLTVLGLGIVGAVRVDHAAARRPSSAAAAHPAGRTAILDGILSPLSTRDWYVFPVAFALAGRLDLLVPAAAVGAHVFWIVTLVILLRVLGRTR